MFLRKAEPSDQFSRGQHEDHFCEIILILGQWFRRKMALTYISYPELCRPFCLAEQIHSCNFCKGHYEEQSMKLFLIWTSGSGGDVV